MPLTPEKAFRFSAQALDAQTLEVRWDIAPGYYMYRDKFKFTVEPGSLGRADWLDSRREELVNRMHERRERDFGVGYGRSSGYGRAGYSSGSYVRAWRPGVFGVR